MTLGIDDVSRLMPGIGSITMDRATSTATIVASDGRTKSFPFEFPPDAGTTIVKLTYFLLGNSLSLKTDRGDTIVAELPSLAGAAPRGGRPVVYLDQKDWSLLANVLHERDRVQSVQERDAAEELIGLAREKKIILPMSLGHMAETSRWTNTERRYRLGLTVAELSRGWQMRHPLDIRRFELQQSLVNRFGTDQLPPLDMFTLAPCAAQGAQAAQQHHETNAGLTAAMAITVEAWTCVSSYFDAILDSEAVPMNPTPSWVSANQEFTAWLAKDSTSASQKRKSILSHLRADLELELLHAVYESGITSAQLETWRTAHFDADIRNMVSLSLFSEIYQDKHLNSGTAWRDNDLIDMMYLSCAAGYADFVVGERSLVSYASQAARRLGRPVKIFRQISELLVGLKST
jgi:hypothetical protein